MSTAHDPDDQLVIRRKAGVNVVGFTNPYLQSEEASTKAGEALMALIEGKEEPKLILSFDGVRFVSSSMIAQVVRLHKAVAKAKGKLRLCGLLPAVRDVLHASHLDRLLDVHDDEASALKDF
ncbi:MAG: STAS domain-containing protein [Isosphaeraceae bacterium]